MMNWSDIGKLPQGEGAAPIAVNVLSAHQLLCDLEQAFVSDRGLSIATLNLDHVVKIQSVPAFRKAYARHSHVTADGNPIVWLSRLAGHAGVSLVPGSELIEPVVDLAARIGVPVALFGATQEVLDKTALELTARHPGLRVVSKIAPAMGFEPESDAAQDHINALKASGARLCLLALGAPKQEIFAARAHEQMPQASFMSIGAGLDFIAGTQTRAPALARLLAVEWLWRLALSPTRLARRYGACIAILPRLTLAALRRRVMSRGEA